jgi:hypothetical protein
MTTSPDRVVGRILSICAILAVAAGSQAGPPGDQQGLAAAPCSADLNGDGVVGVADVTILLEHWGPVTEPTTTVALGGNLNVSGAVATAGSTHESRAFYLTPTLLPGLEMMGYEDLTVLGNDLYIDDGAGGAFLALEAGRQAIVTVDGVEKGVQDMGTHTFGFMTPAQAAVNGVDAFGSTMNDFLDFLDRILGLDATSVGGLDLGGRITIGSGFAYAGKLLITGNEGTVQDLDIRTTDLTVTYADPLGIGLSYPFVLTKTGQADGGSAWVEFEVYDSLCVSVAVSFSLILQPPSPFGPAAFWLAESSDSDDVDRLVGLGVISFDNYGQYWTATNANFAIIRHNGAISPLVATFDFESSLGGLTALGCLPSWLFAVPGYGAHAADLNGDGRVGVEDFLRLLARWD